MSAASRRDEPHGSASNHRRESVGSSGSSDVTETSHDEIESIREDGRPGLERYSTHLSQGPDCPVEPMASVIEIPDEFYDRIPHHRKVIIVAILSFCSFLAPISSTSVLSATPEVAEEYKTTGSIVNLSSALYMLFMGISPVVWGPFSQVYGRRAVTVVTSVLFFGCSIGTALAPNLAAFFVFRILTAFEGTAFILVGSAAIGDIYRPTERGTAIGWFLSGTLIGPALGPFIGGIIVTYTSWRVIFWLQTGLSGAATICAWFLIPETIFHKRLDDLAGHTRKQQIRVLWHMVNPWRVLRLYRYPNLAIASLASAAVIWNMYSLLAPIRYVLNPRFNLTTPLQGGLFYLAPGAGYFVGSFFGGRYADFVLKKYMTKRNGVRIPEDRLNSAVPFMGIVIPVCMLIYGWSVQKGVGGLPLPIIVMFIQGVAQLFCFPSLNTYCLDVMADRGAEVIAGNYFFRYMFAFGGTAVVLPAVEAIGVGWFSAISSVFLVLSALALMAAIRHGKHWRESIDAKKKARKLSEKRRAVTTAADHATDQESSAVCSETDRKVEV